MYTDATFKEVPKGFYQVLVFMGYSRSLKKYVPCAYVLMTGKTSECYYQAFSWLHGECPDLSPFSVGVDFERALLETAQAQFPDAIIVGCLFHWKQAILKKLKALGVRSDQRSYALKQGVMDVLTVIPREELEDGIAFVKNEIDFFVRHNTDDYAGDKLLWEAFWENYFKK